MEIRTHHGCLNARGTVVCLQCAKRWEKWAPFLDMSSCFRDAVCCCVLITVVAEEKVRVLTKLATTKKRQENKPLMCREDYTLI